MRWSSIAMAGGVLGVVAGSATALTLRSPPAPAPEPQPEVQVVTPPASADGSADPAPVRERRRVLLAWTPGGLPDGFDEDVANVAGVRNTTVVRAGRVDLIASETATGQPVDAFARGWSVPLDAFAIDRRTYRQMVPPSARDVFSALRTQTVLLSETSARLRRVDVGDRLLLAGGERFTVAGVVDDTLVGAAEVVFVNADAARVGVTSPRFTLIEYRGARDRVESAIRRAVPDNKPVRVRGPGEAPYLRHGDAVLPQSVLKDTFGEFAYRPGNGRQFDQDRQWQQRHLVNTPIPLLGEVRCHRGLMEALRGAMTDLREQGLAHLVDRDQYQGCWNPRLITQGGALSHHAWGVAVDLNAGANPTGVGSGQDPRLVEVMERWGFTWGGFWLIPDPMHFEYMRPPVR